jgi:hypothetical protein
MSTDRIQVMPDHFVGVNKMIGRRLTSEKKKALKNADRLEDA